MLAKSKYYAEKKMSYSLEESSEDQSNHSYENEQDRNTQIPRLQ